MRNKILVCTTLLVLLYVLVWSSKLFLPNVANSLPKLSFKSDSPKPSLLCWVMTVDSAYHRRRSDSIRATWGRRCDKLLLVRNGTELAEKSGILTVPLVHEGRDQLWHKVTAAFTSLHKHYLHQYDWFMKTDDDTFVIVETLKNFLAHTAKPSEPVYFGHKFKPFVKQGYMSGGSGYVLSRRALQLLVEKGFDEKRPECHMDGGQVEDIEMGGCLESVNVTAGDTRDSKGRPTFLALSPLDLLDSKHFKSSWYHQYAFYAPTQPGKNCCSSKPISFHYIEPNLMYFIDWILYEVKRVVNFQDSSRQID